MLPAASASSSSSLEKQQQPVFGINEADFATAATLLRVGTFRDKARKLYTYFQPQVLEWPSLSVAWVPSRKKVDGFRDFSLQTVVVGTQAAEGELNYLTFIEAAVPLPLEDIDTMIRAEEDLENPEEMEKVPFRRVQGHTRMTQFVAVDGPVLRLLYCCPNQGVDTIAVRTATTPNILLYNCFRDRYKFSTDPKRNAPDLCLRPRPAKNNNDNNNNGNDNNNNEYPLAGIGFGLACSECEEGLFAAGGDDGVVYVWKFDAERMIDPPEYEELNKQQRQRAAMRREMAATALGSPFRDVDEHGRTVATTSRPISSGLTETELVPPRPTTILYSAMRLSGHTGEVTDVSCHGTQPHILVSSSATGQCALWDLRVKSGAVSGLQQHVPPRHIGGVNTIAFHPRASFQVATGGNDGVVKLWDIRSWKDVEVGAYSYHNKPVLRVNWAPFDDCVFGSSGEDGLVCIWDLNRGVETRSDAGEEGVPKELAFVHAGHASCVPDFDWCPNLNDEYAIASVDHTNLLQLWRPNDAAISANVKADAFDHDDLD